MLPGESAEAGDLIWGGFVGEGSGVWRGAAEFAGSPDASSFLINRDEGMVVAEGDEAIGEGANLLSVDEIPREEDVARRLDVAKEGGFFFGEDRAIEADDEAVRVHELASEALMKPEKMGCGLLGFDLNSGWNCTAT